MRRALILGLGPALGAALFGGFLWFQAIAEGPPESPEAVTDGIAVLTGGADRVETGLRLLLAGQARLLLVTGAHRDARLADFAERAHIDPAPIADRVTIGRAAATTRGNAAEIAAWARAEALGSLRIVTAGYHMARALVEIRRALPPEVRLLAHPVQPPRRWSRLAGEYGKWLLAWAGLSALAPARSAS